MATLEATPIAVASPVRRGYGFWADAWRRLRLNRAAMAGLVGIVLFVALALLAPLIAPYNYGDGNLLHATELPSVHHWLGTDSVGRDILSRLLYGARISLSVAVAAQVAILLVGVPIGLATGYAGGWFDMVVMRLVDAIYALPNLLLAILIMSMLRSNISQSAKVSTTPLTVLDRVTGGLIGIFIVLILTHWLTVSRLVRGQVLSVKEREYVAAAKALGATPLHIVKVHILPNILAPVIVAAAFGIPGAIMLEASLSFLGIGVNPPIPSWGLMISDGLVNLQSYPHMLVPPAVVLGLTLLSFTFLGDGLRDAMDPHGTTHKR
jgi:ABC-type dipeptide/oligopeptide/nickel transport system permease subunit